MKNKKLDTVDKLIQMARRLNCRISATFTVSKFGRLDISEINLLPSNQEDDAWKKYIG